MSASCRRNNGIVRKKKMWNECELPSITDDLLDKFGYVMAIGHYFYEADFGLKALKDRADNFSAHQHVDITRVEKRLLISLAHGYIKVDRSKTDKTYGLEDIKADMCGTRDRRYCAEVYKLLPSGPGSKRVYYICDLPSCLLTLGQLKKLDKTRTLALEVSQCQRIYLSFANMLYTLFRRLARDEPFARQFNIECRESKFLHEYLENNTKLSEPQLVNVDELDHKDTGFILAVQYYFNYLGRLLPTLQKRLKEFEEEKLLPRKKLVPNMIVVNPMSGCLEGKIGGLLCSDSFEVAGKLKTHTITMGITRRDFCGTVYKVCADHERKHLDKNYEDYYCYVEYSSPVKQMKRTQKDRIGTFAHVCVEELIKQFDHWLRNILAHYGHDRLISVILWDDRRERDISDDVDKDPTYLSLIEVLQEHCAELLAPNEE